MPELGNQKDPWNSSQIPMASEALSLHRLRTTIGKVKGHARQAYRLTESRAMLFTYAMEKWTGISTVLHAKM
jgi:hypothetical protein